jgi:chromosome segregation ATPase
MSRIEEIERRLQGAFSEPQAEVLAEVITQAYDDLVKVGDFNELKEIVRDLAQAQARTETRVDTLAMRMEELAQAQARTERTVEKLAQGMDEFRQELTGLRQEVGGLSRTVGYALENEAYRALPQFLMRVHQLRVTERFVRTEIEGEEMDFLAHGVRADGRGVLIVGESKGRLDERRGLGESAAQVLAALQRKVAAVGRAHAGVEIVPLLVTHYARPAFLEAAREQGVIVAQSFEW